MRIIYVILQGMIERKWKNKFSPKEKIMLVEIAKGSSPLQAAVQAGYSEGWASVNVDRKLAQESFQVELQLIKDEIAEVGETVTLKELLDEFRIIGTANITDFYDYKGDVLDVTEIDPQKARAIKEIKRTINPKNGHVTVTLTMHDKVAALQNLGRIGGHYAADNGQTSGDVNIQLNLPGGLTNL